MSYLRLSDIQTPLMTRFEFERMRELEAGGMTHDAAKAQIYAERGPSGQPRSSGPTQPVAPATSAPQTSKQSGVSVGRVLAIGAGVGLAAFGLAALIRFGRSPQGGLHVRLGDDPEFDAEDAPTGALMRNGELVRGVIYARGETGWVEDLGDGTCRVANVPFSAPFNIDDVATLVDKDDRLALGRLVSREFPKKSGVRYPAPHRQNFRALREAFEAEGWKLEGGVGGMALLAHRGRRSPAEVAKSAGVEVDVEPMRLS